MLIKHLSAAILAVLLFSSSASADPLKELYALQGEVTTVVASFSQKKYTELRPRPISSKGKVFMKNYVGVKWEYFGEMNVYFNGQEIFVYYMEVGEVEHINGSVGYTGPMMFDVRSLEADFEISASEDGGVIALTLTPKNEMPFSTIEMTFPPSSPFPQKMIVHDKSAGRTEIEFYDVRLGVSLTDDMFYFTPPDNVVVYEVSFD